VGGFAEQDDPRVGEAIEGVGKGGSERIGQVLGMGTQDGRELG
jgi:hypothetical protein